MKTIDQINEARNKISQKILTQGLNTSQSAMLCGMLNALAWAADGANCSTMDRLLADEPMAVGKDSGDAFKMLEKIREAFWDVEAN